MIYSYLFNQINKMSKFCILCCELTNSGCSLCNTQTKCERCSLNDFNLFFNLKPSVSDVLVIPCKHVPFTKLDLFLLKIIMKQINRNTKLHNSEMNIQSQFTPEIIEELQLLLLDVVDYLQSHSECKFLILDKLVFHTFSQTFCFEFFQDYINMLLITFAINDHDTNCKIVEIFIALLSQYAIIITNCNCGDISCIGGINCTSDKLCYCEGYSWCVCPHKNYTSTTCTLNHSNSINNCNCETRIGYFQNLSTTPFEKKLLATLTTYLSFNELNMNKREFDQYVINVAEIKENERKWTELLHSEAIPIAPPVMQRSMALIYNPCPCGLDTEKQHNRPIDCIIAKRIMSKFKDRFVEKLFVLQLLVQNRTITLFLASYILYTLFGGYVVLDDSILEITYIDMLFLMIRLYPKIE